MKFHVPSMIASPLEAIGMVKVVSQFTDGVAPEPQIVVVQPSAMGSVVAIMNSLLSIFALILMFQRNDGIDVGAMILICCCCTPCYVAYALALPTGRQKIHF